ncbi:MAG: cardiolipin synthase [Clostridia bacterium]|nr:cardiolipin synthase [Clostridia bacterium]
MRFLKKLFSKYILIAILLLAQLVALNVFLDILRNKYIWAELAIMLLELICFFAVINKKEPPEFKLPWAFLLLAFPLIGLLAYIVFGNKRMRRKSVKELRKVEAAMAPYVIDPPKPRDRERDDLHRFYTAFEYVSHTDQLIGTYGNRVEFFSTGETFFADITEKLKEAEEFIFIEFFILEPGKVWDGIYEVLKEKAAQGVDVRIMFDDIGSAGKAGHRFCKEVRSHGIKIVAFNKVIPLLSGIYNNRDHRKIVVIDHKYGYTGGLNLADEYANITHPFGHWKDTGVRIEGKAIRNLISMFLELYDVSAKTVSDYESLLSYDYPVFDEPGFVLPFGDGPKPYYEDMIGEGNYINMLNAATKYVDISSPYLIPTYPLTVAIRNAARRGVRVRLMLPGIPDKKLVFKMAKSNFKYLCQAGVEIYIYKPGFNHEKCAVVDGRMAFVGTINLDFRSLVHHFECGVIMYETPCIQQIEQDFEETFAKCERVVNPEFHGYLIFSLANIFSPLF